MKTIFLLLMISFANFARAACHAVSPAGSSTGADWNHTMSIPSVPVRGDTYYLQNGTYASPNFSSGVSPHTGGATITFLKARDSGDHGQNCNPSIAAGWTSSMGAQATITSQFEVLDDNWTLDGQDNNVGSGCPVIDNLACYGIYIDGTSCTGSGSACYNVDTKNGAGFTLRYVSIQGSSPANNNTSCNNTQTCNTDDNLRFVSFGGLGSGCNNVTIQHVFVYNSSHNDLTVDGCANMLVENSEFYINAAGSFYHGQAFNIVDGGNDSMTIRYNVFRDITGTADIVNLAASGGTNNGINIYGNIFYSDSAWSPTGTPCENGIYACINNIVCNDLKFYNNSIVDYNVGSPLSCGVAYLNTATVQSGHSAIVQNNLWYGTGTAGVGLACSGGATCTQDHNSFLNSGTGSSGTANVINQSATCPLSSCSSTWSSTSQFSAVLDNSDDNNGISLSSPYNLDFVGATRNTSDWTRGAFQFVSGGGQTPPSNGIRGNHIIILNTIIPWMEMIYGRP